MVHDIRVEGVQRTEAGTVFSYLPIKVGERIDDEKAAAGGQGAVRHRLLSRRAPRGAGRRADRHRAGAPDDQPDRLRRQQGIRHRHAQEGAEGDRHRRGAHLRPLRARPRRAGNEAPVHHARPLRGEGARPPSRRRSATASPSTSRSTKARWRRSRRINIVGNKAFTEKELRDEMMLTTPGWLVLVHEERPVLEAEAHGRPRNAAQLLPESRLPRVQHRIDAGVDHAGQGRHLHHDQHHRGAAATRSPTSRSPATCRCRRPSCSGSIQVKPGDVFSRERLQASIKDISDRLGDDGYAFANVNAVPEIDRDKRDGRVHVLRRPGPPRLRAPDQHQRQHADARRGDPARDAPARRAPGTTARGSSARRCGSSGSATSRTSTSRRRRCRAPPTRSTST